MLIIAENTVCFFSYFHIYVYESVSEKCTIYDEYVYMQYTV